jgi:hypothetical protein
VHKTGISSKGSTHKYLSKINVLRSLLVFDTGWLLYMLFVHLVGKCDLSTCP